MRGGAAERGRAGGARVGSAVRARRAAAQPARRAARALPHPAGAAPAPAQRTRTQPARAHQQGIYSYIIKKDDLTHVTNFGAPHVTYRKLSSVIYIDVS